MFFVSVFFLFCFASVFVPRSFATRIFNFANIRVTKTGGGGEFVHWEMKYKATFCE